MRLSICLLITLTFTTTNLHTQIGRLALSPVQKVEQKIGITEITLEYSRPSMRGRDIFGGLVPYNQLWRTGANRNTTIQFSQDIIINNTRIESGKYAIFSIPTHNQWEIIFYRDTDNWDVPEVLDISKIVGQTTVPSQPLEKSLEAFTITIGDFTNYALNLNIAWSDVIVSIPIELTTKEIMDDRINNILEGPDYNDYYAAAQYEMESGKDYKRGLQWINKAIEITDEVTWWDLRIKAIILMELGKREEALSLANKGLIEATAESRAYGISEFERILGRLKN